MRKEDRLRIYEKYNGHCAYCGKEIAYRDMQVDHISPKWRNDDEKTLEMKGIEKGKDEFSNYNPSCRSCNFRKGTLSVEEFREELVKQCENIVKRSFQVRQSIDYGLLRLDYHPIVFYFEQTKH